MFRIRVLNVRRITPWISHLCRFPNIRSSWFAPRGLTVYICIPGLSSLQRCFHDTTKIGNTWPLSRICLSFISLVPRAVTSRSVSMQIHRAWLKRSPKNFRKYIWQHLSWKLLSSAAVRRDERNFLGLKVKTHVRTTLEILIENFGLVWSMDRSLLGLARNCRSSALVLLQP